MNVYPSDNKLSQYTYTTTKPGDIFSLPPTTPPTINNEPTLTTTKPPPQEPTTRTSSNSKSKSIQNHQEKDNEADTDTDTDSQPIRKLQVSSNEAMAASVVEETPCVKRHYYKLGNEGSGEVPVGESTPEESPGKA